jgi:hypothetical protein
LHGFFVRHVVSLSHSLSDLATFFDEGGAAFQQQVQHLIIPWEDGEISSAVCCRSNGRRLTLATGATGRYHGETVNGAREGCGGDGQNKRRPGAGNDQMVPIQGKPLSETIIEERR